MGDLAFTSTFWYGSVDLHQLEEEFNETFLRRLYLHIVAFDLNRLVSFAPSRIEFGPFASFVDREFFSLWSEVTYGIWSQWRFENDRPDYGGPSPGHELASPWREPPVRYERGPVRNLAFCGGGKDSLLAMKILDEAGQPYDTLGYSHSIYGRAEPQHVLIEKLAEHGRGRTHHRMWMFEDLMDSPVLDLEEEVDSKTLTAGETPSSIFAGLPLALAHGFDSFILAHEKSADVGNLEWDRTGEEINHQWGKSLEAEALVGDYIRSRLLEGFDYFSILKPLQDAVIFASLNRFLDAVPSTHSCNIDKPWCRRCAKCVYVWLNYQAYLPTGIVDDMFGENLFDVRENLTWFQQLLGLAEHTPFECVGQVEESRLAFELCRIKGLRGRAMDIYVDQVAPKPTWEDVAHLYDVEGNPARIAHHMESEVQKTLLRLGREGGESIRAVLEERGGS